ncbi:hypothetical protein MBLNU13_g03043t1 [Cladosporium sp. NU13]
MSYNEHLTSGLAGIWNCTTSEAAERIAPKRKRISQDSLREEIPWTAARCNRLLRTITSRVNILRKQSKLCAAGSSMREAQSSRDSSRCPSEEDASPPRKERKPSAHDPEWVPGAETKTSSRTYGGKCRPKSALRKADSGFSTPFVKRLLKNGPLSAAKSWPGATRADERPKKTLQLPVQLASRNEEAQRNLVRALDNLLTATGSASTAERVGARSLMGACLRRVPDYIDLELEDLDEENEEDENITSSLYSELESLGTNSSGGWSGLREVVRSHGLHHVRAAIDEGLIKESRISELVAACSKHGALLEADALLQIWISRDQSIESGRVDESHVALAKLSELRTTHDASELFLRHHADLVRSGHVYLGDILRPGSTTLKDMISALLRGPGQDTALAYLEAAAIEDYTTNTTSLPVFSRLAGLLTSLTFAQNGDADSSKPDLDLSMVVHRVATTIAWLQAEDKDAAVAGGHSASITRKHNDKIHPFIMASTLLQLTSQIKKSTFITTPFTSLTSAITAHQNTFIKFAVNVAHHVHRFSDADELESLLITTSGLLAPPPGCVDETRSTLNRLAFEIAFAYREQTGIEIDEHFFDGKLAASNEGATTNTAQTPRRRVQVSGYKWEEGLCEWVAATPLAKPPTKASAQPPPKQLLAPHKESNEVPLTLPPSPKVVISAQSSPQTDDTRSIPTRPALQERSANQHLRPSSQQNKPASFLKPAMPKQVHLKEERAKKAAAALLARESSASSRPLPPPKRAPLKRSVSLANTSSAEKRPRPRSASVDTDELGMLTPARKKSKRARIAGTSSSSFRTSLPAQALDGMSEDELGL